MCSIPGYHCANCHVQSPDQLVSSSTTISAERRIQQGEGVLAHPRKETTPHLVITLCFQRELPRRDLRGIRDPSIVSRRVGSSDALPEDATATTFALGGDGGGVFAFSRLRCRLSLFDVDM